MISTAEILARQECPDSMIAVDKLVGGVLVFWDHFGDSVMWTTPAEHCETCGTTLKYITLRHGIKTCRNCRTKNGRMKRNGLDRKDYPHFGNKNSKRASPKETR